MDLDGDGQLDILSGSWPGEIFFFKGDADRSFAAPVKLRGKDGRAINVGGGIQPDNGDMILVAGDATHETNDDGSRVIVYEGERIAVPEGKQAGITGTASAVHAVDFTGDGKLDLLVGDIGGNVYLIENEATAAMPVWGAARRLTAGGQPLHVNGDAGPFACDWDGDGLIDLLVGDGEGAVWFFKNVGRGKAPEFAASTEILPSVEVQYGAGAAAEPRRGIRSKVCAVAWTGGGRPDLLVGDFTTQKANRPEPTPEEKAEQDGARKALSEVQTRWQHLYEKLFASGAKRITDKAERVKLEAEFKRAREELSSLYDKVPSEYENHGWIWWFKRVRP